MLSSLIFVRRYLSQAETIWQLPIAAQAAAVVAEIPSKSPYRSDADNAEAHVKLCLKQA